MQERGSVTERTDRGSELPSLSGAFAKDEVSVALTTAGLLPRQTEELVRLYAEELSWDGAAERWHEERRASRGSRESAQKILHLIRERLNAADESLPSLRRLADLLDLETSNRGRSQVLYLYLVEADALVRYVLHALLCDQGLDRPHWDLSKSAIRRYLSAFRYEDGAGLEYADSTLDRWAKGFRSVLYEIGVRESKYANEGVTPLLQKTPLAVSAGFSWHCVGSGWKRAPIGWMYLFQAKDAWPSLRDRLRELPGWEQTQSPRGSALRPVSDPFSAEAVR